MVRTTKDLNLKKEWAVWLPAALALSYFYSWVFEFFVCLMFNIPTSFIEPTIGSILFFIGVAIAIVLTTSYVIGSMYLVVKDITISVLLPVLIVLIILAVGIFFACRVITSKGFFESAQVMLEIFIGFNVALVLVKTVSKRITWRFIYNMVITDADEELKATPLWIKRHFLSLSLLAMFAFTIIAALAYVKTHPPSLRIIGKEPLVIVRKYGDIVICRYLDTNRNILNDNIRIFKLDSGITLRELSPAPAY